VGFVYVAHDVTERKRAEEELRKRNAFIETILDKLPIGLSVNSIADGRTIYVNAKFEEIYGWPRSVLSDVDEFFNHVYPDPDYRKKMQEMIMADISSGDPLRMRWEGVQITTQTGTTKFVTAVNIPLVEQDLMISTVQDVTERMRAERGLNESEKRYKRLVESVTDYIYAVRVENGRPAKTMYGPGCFAVTGYTAEEYDADPDLWSRIIHPADRDAVAEHDARVVAGQPAIPLEHRIIHKSGSLRWVRNTAAPRFDQNGLLIDYDGMIRDITQVKHLESQLRQAQKMEAIGQLAGGVAHDFNNILTAIVGYGNLLAMKLPENCAEGDYARQILASAERAAHLTHSLLAFSRKQFIDLKPVDINAIIGQVQKLLVRVIGEDIELKTRMSKADLPVLADSVQIEQVLMNLATNARDAMANGGMLMIETDTFDMGEDFLKTHAYGKPGLYALIAVTDTGEGMSEDVRSKIFEPFFTTKEVGKGTGLGLSMVYGIIKQHGGYVNVYSEPGRGTTFKIYLPLIVTAQPPVKKNSPAVIPRGRETVLLAEDDQEVRKLMRTILADFGYRVIEAEDGDDALQKFREHPGIDLLVSDVVMPRKSGNDLYQELKKIRPDIKALFTSGYTASMANTKGILDRGLEVVLKPLSPEKLLQKVRDVLDKK
jgi:PAS domain S-box-containing protein